MKPNPTIPVSVRERIEEIFTNFNDWGYQYRMSDYASSSEKEKKYETEGKEALERLKNDILKAVREALLARWPEEQNGSDPKSLRNEEYDDLQNLTLRVGYNTALKETRQIVEEVLQ